MYYDLLAKIRNAERAKKDTMTGRFSNLDFAVAKVLKEEGYLEQVQKKTVGKKDYLEIKLPKNDKNREIRGFKILSKPSRRLYIKHQNLKPVKQGYGIVVISTSAGVMSGKTAKKNKIGGEYLLEVW